MRKLSLLTEPKLGPLSLKTGESCFITSNMEAVSKIRNAETLTKTIFWTNLP